MQIIAEQGDWNGLLFGLDFAACLSKNPQNPQSLKLPLNKEILRILPKLQKNERNAKKYVPFFPRCLSLKYVDSCQAS